MTEVTTKDLQEIAVNCVSGFFNHNVPLSEGLCKAACDRGLNSEQLKRAVEATNSLAHLNNIRVNSDRTSEFPLADYDEIVKMASMPEGFDPDVIPTLQADSTDTGMDKTASFELGMPTLNQTELKIGFLKEAAVNRRALEIAEQEAEILKGQILTKAAELREELKSHEALSKASKKEDLYKKASFLVWGELKEHLDFAEFLPIEKKAMDKASSLLDMLAQAEQLVDEIQHRRGLDKQASEIEAGMKKEAIFGLLGRGVGAAISAPFKAVGNAVRKGGTRLASNVSDRVGTKINNTIANTSFGQKAGMTARSLKPETIKSGKKLATGVAVSGALLDAATYNPSTNKVTGVSSDVWDTLHN